MNLFFFVYRQIEFQNFFPVALEIKQKIKKAKIYFIFTDASYYQKILEDKFIKKGLQKYFKIILLKQNNSLIVRKINSLYLTIFFLINIIKRKTILFFPTIPFVKQYKLITNFCKIRGGKNIYLAKNRAHAKSVPINYFKETLKNPLNFKQKDIDFFDHFVFYQNDNIFLRKILSLSKSNQLKIIHVGLPNLYPSWKEFIDKSGIIIKKKLKQKYKSFTSIYTLILAKDFSKIDQEDFLKKKSSQIDSVKKVLETIDKIDPKSLVFLKTHPRDIKTPKYLDKILSNKKNNKRTIITSTNIEILASISKRCIFPSNTDAITTLYNINKIDVAEYKDFKNKKINLKQRAKGSRTVYINPKDRLFLTKMKNFIFNDKAFEKNSIIYKEKDLLQKNQPSLNKLFEVL